MSKTEKDEKVPETSQTLAGHFEVGSASGVNNLASLEDDSTHHQCDQATEVRKVSDDTAASVEHGEKVSKIESSDHTIVVGSEHDNPQLTKAEKEWLSARYWQTYNTRAERDRMAEGTANAANMNHDESSKSSSQAGTGQEQFSTKPFPIQFPFRMRLGPKGTITTCKDLVAEGLRSKRSPTFADVLSFNPSTKRKASSEEVREPSQKRHHTTWNTPTDVMNFWGYYASGRIFTPRPGKHEASEDLVPAKAKSPRIIRPLPKTMRKKTFREADGCLAPNNMISLSEAHEKEKEAGWAWDNINRVWPQISEWATSQNFMTVRHPHLTELGTC